MKRRKLLKTFVAYAAFRAGGVSADDHLAPTGSDVEGPYYPVETIPVTASLFTGENALGDPLAFSGRILNTRGVPLPGLRIEIWQCDATQTYNHPADRVDNRDRQFRGFAAQISDSDGYFSFETIVPVSYAGRPPHIHVKLWREQSELLTTQVYLEGYRGSKDRQISPARVAGADVVYEARFNFVV